MNSVMDAITLNIGQQGKGMGIFPDYADADAKTLELRARTFLAYAYAIKQCALIKTLESESGTLVLISTKKDDDFTVFEKAWSSTAPVNSGVVYTSDFDNPSWNKQPGRLVLFVENGTNVDELLSNYFAVSLRWLDDRQGVKSSIDLALRMAGH